MTSYAAEWFKVVRRRTLWAFAGIWLVLAFGFEYIDPYVKAGALHDAGQHLAALRPLLPDVLPAQTVSGYSLWGGALIIAFGALVFGSEYGWGTWKTLFTIRPCRLTVLMAQVGAVGTALAVLVAVDFLVSAAASALIARSLTAPVQWPGVVSLLRGAGAGWLILFAYALFGGLGALVTRGTALAIGLGVTWVLVIETLLRGLAGSVPLLRALIKFFPGVNAGALAAAVGSRGGINIGIVGGAHAVAVIVGYAVLFIVLSGWILTRRDVP